MGLHSHSFIQTPAKYHVSENACLTACITKRKWVWEGKCPKIISSKKIFASNKIPNEQTSQISPQGYSVFFVFFPTSA